MAGVAIVTGGSRGIGRVASIKLAAAGHSVVVNYVRDGAAAGEVVAEIARGGGTAQAVRGDVGNEADVLALFAAADRLGPLRALINNAGVVDVTQRLDEMSAARLQRMLGINVIGSMLCAREAVKRMSTRHGGQGGSIVNVSSVAATLGGAGQYIDYAAAKGAIDTFTIGLAREVAGEGIRVSAVRPGIIDTGIHASGGNPDRARQLAPTVPMLRAGTPEEVADAIVWLASGAASYVTGAILDVAGGR